MGRNKSSLTPLPVILKEIQQFNPFAPGDFGEKKYKELTLTTKPLAGRTLHSLLIQIKILACKVRARTESKSFGA